jgi:serine/threonine protein kinase
MNGTEKQLEEKRTRMMDHVGRQLGNYRLLQLLGQGGFAEVYLGEHVRLGMKAAVKVLHTNLVGEEVQAFQREAQIIAELEHPHIIRVLDFDVQNRIPFLVLDYAPNGSLREKHPRGKPIPLALVVQYVQQVASALQYAHEHKLIHRDIKPENMLVGKQGEVRLSDFGIASVAHSTSSMNTQATTGTLSYIAPEQIQGKPRPASDQYALAITVYQWLSGELPFQGSSTEIIAQHLMVAPPPLRSKAPSVSSGVEEVVMKALAKDPKDRFSSVQAFASALMQASKIDQAPLNPLLPDSASTLPPTLPANAPNLPPTLPAGMPVLATPPNLPPQTPVPLNTPAEARFVRSLLPASSGAARWRTWLIGTVIIMGLGLMASLVIPALIVYGPHGTPNPTNTSGNDGQNTSQIEPKPIPCSVGTQYDPASGKVTGVTFAFPKTSDLYLVCTFPANFFTDTYKLSPNDVSETITNPDGTKNTVATELTPNTSGKVDTAHHIYYDEQFFFDPGDYTWSIASSPLGADYVAGSMQITIGSSSTTNTPAQKDITKCQVGTGYKSDGDIIEGEGSSFPLGTTVYLVCHLASGVDDQSVSDQLTGQSTGTIETGPGLIVGQGSSDVYYNIYIPENADSYTWEALYQGTSEISVQFQIS